MLIENFILRKNKNHFQFLFLDKISLIKEDLTIKYGLYASMLHDEKVSNIN